MGGDISEKVQEHLDEYGDTYTRKTKETSDIDRDRSNVDGNMSTRQATRGTVSCLLYNVSTCNIKMPFIFQLRDYPCNITHDIFFLYTTDIFRTKADTSIPRIFLEHECIFCG